MKNTFQIYIINIFQSDIQSMSQQSLYPGLNPNQIQMFPGLNHNMPPGYPPYGGTSHK